MDRIPETQMESWGKCQIEGLSKKLGMVRDVIEKRGGATTFEVAEELGWSVHCVSGKITNLKDRGKLRDSGQRKIHQTATKRTVIIWEACDIIVEKPSRTLCTTCCGSGYLTVGSA